MITILFILLLGLIILGPKRLSQVATGVGRHLAHYQQLKSDVQTRLQRELLDLRGDIKMASSVEPSKVHPM